MKNSTLKDRLGRVKGAEVDSLVTGDAVITLELSSRFLADYLTGGRYFPDRLSGAQPGEGKGTAGSVLGYGAAYG